MVYGPIFRVHLVLEANGSWTLQPKMQTFVARLNLVLTLPQINMEVERGSI